VRGEDERFAGGTCQPGGGQRIDQMFSQLNAGAWLLTKASALLAAGVHLKVIQEILGRSRYATTAELYASVPTRALRRIPT